MSNQTEPIIAWRAWKLDLDTCLLKSYYKRQVIWHPGKAMKTDISPTIPRREDIESMRDSRSMGSYNNFGRPHKSLPIIMTTGIHAWKTMKELIDYVNYDKEFCVLGKIAIWGKISEHEKGYRAEFAYPIKLEFLPYINYHTDYLKLDIKEIENKLRNNYGCEVGDFRFTGERTLEDGTKMYLENGLFHKYGGPAIKHFDGAKEWWQHGNYWKKQDAPIKVKQILASPSAPKTPPTGGALSTQMLSDYYNALYKDINKDVMSWMITGDAGDSFISSPLVKPLSAPPLLHENTINTLYKYMVEGFSIPDINLKEDEEGI